MGDPSRQSNVFGTMWKGEMRVGKERGLRHRQNGVRVAGTGGPRDCLMRKCSARGRGGPARPAGRQALAAGVLPSAATGRVKFKHGAFLQEVGAEHEL